MKSAPLQSPIFQGQMPLVGLAVSPGQSSVCRVVAEYEALARTRLSENFILRDLMFSTEAAALGFNNFPEYPHLVIAAGQALCENILEPLLAQFGRFAITFGYQSRDASAAGSLKSSSSNPRSSNPHQWDRQTFGNGVYARVDILPFCVEDHQVSRLDFGRWMMMNLNVDLLMQWKRSNVYCISISPKPRRVWFEWGSAKLGEPRQTIFMGTDYWQRVYPSLPLQDRPRYGPSCTGGRITWTGAV